jgi:hypothetical protein
VPAQKAECIDRFPVLKVPPYKGFENGIGDNCGDNYSGKNSMSGRKWVRKTVIGVTGLALLYSAAWFVIADRLEDVITHWAAERREQGWVASHSAVRLDGFPFAWRANITDPTLASQGMLPAFRWSGPSITLDWRPWNARRIGFTAPGGHLLDLVDSSIDGAAKGSFRLAQGAMLFGKRGALASLTLTLDDAILGEQDSDRVEINRLEVTLDTAPPPRREAVPEKTASLRLTGAIHGLTLPKKARAPLGRTIGGIELNATLLGHIAPGKTGSTTRETLAAWRDDGGIVEIDHFRLGWSRLILDSSGTLALDANLQPIVASSATIRGHGETLNALVGAGTLGASEALMARMAFGLLQRGGGNGKPPEIKISLTIQDGWLYVGPVKLLRLAPIKWQKHGRS